MPVEGKAVAWPGDLLCMISSERGGPLGVQSKPSSRLARSTDPFRPHIGHTGAALQRNKSLLSASLSCFSSTLSCTLSSMQCLVPLPYDLRPAFYTCTYCTMYSVPYHRSTLHGIEGAPPLSLLPVLSSLFGPGPLCGCLFRESLPPTVLLHHAIRGDIPSAEIMLTGVSFSMFHYRTMAITTNVRMAYPSQRVGKWQTYDIT